MATRVLNRDKGLDLSTLYNDLAQGEDKKLKAHKSVDDAEMTMVVAKEICRKENCNLEKLMYKFPQDRGFVFRGRVVDDAQNVFHLNAKRGKGRSRALHRYIECQRPAKDGRFKDARIAFAEEYPWINPAEKMLMISLINENGGIYTNEKEKADILIKKSTKNKKPIKAQAFATKIYEPTISEKKTKGHVQSRDANVTNSNTKTQKSIQSIDINDTNGHTKTQKSIQSIDINNTNDFVKNKKQ